VLHQATLPTARPAGGARRGSVPACSAPLGLLQLLLPRCRRQLLLLLLAAWLPAAG
jgi:hypothetical protein